MKALVIDDNELVRDNVAEVLRGEGWEVCEADSAARAFEMLGEGESWRLVFCDVKLSDAHEAEGYAVLRRFLEDVALVREAYERRVALAARAAARASGLPEVPVPAL